MSEFDNMEIVKQEKNHLIFSDTTKIFKFLYKTRAISYDSQELVIRYFGEFCVW